MQRSTTPRHATTSMTTRRERAHAPRAATLRTLLAAFAALTLAACSTTVPEPEAALDPALEAVQPGAEASTAFTVSPATPEVGQKVTFDASAATCAAAPCTYAWNDVLNGTWPLGTGSVITFTFQGAGVKQVRLSVTDAKGRVTHHRTDVRVYAPGTAPAPEPDTGADTFSVSPEAPAPGQAVTFDASAITCASPCSYAWEDVANGTWPLGEGKTLRFTFRDEGVKQVRLTLRDSHGAVRQFRVDVRVAAGGGGTTPAPAPSPTPTEPPTSSGARLTWSPPSGYANYRVVNVPVRGGIGNLDNGTDYLLVMPSSPRREPLTINGGRNVVMIGGEIDIDVKPVSGGRESAHRGIYVTGGSVQGRIVHIEGLLIGSRNGTISDGFHVSRGSSGNHFVLQIQNVRIGPLPRAYFGGTVTHPDLIQTWGGVGEIRIDKLTGVSAYQGLFFKADFNGRHGDIHIRRTNLRGLDDGRYLLWLSDKGGGWPDVSLSDVWIQPSPGRSFAKTIWPDSGSGAPRISGGEASWTSLPITGAIRSGAPSGGDFVPASAVGIGYTSPGYR